MSAGILHLELSFKGLLETGGSLEQLVLWGRVGGSEDSENVCLRIRHRPRRRPGRSVLPSQSSWKVRLTIVWSSPSLQHGHHPSCNRPRTLTAATGRCMSGPFASVIGAAEVPAGPVQGRIRLNEVELNSIKSNPIALNSIKRILFNSLQTFSACSALHHPSIHGGFKRSIFVDIYRLTYSKHLLAPSWRHFEFNPAV